MHILLSILLYLQLLFVGGTYTGSEIQGIVTAHEAQVSDIEANSDLTDEIVAQYGPEADTIIIIDPFEN